MDTSLVDSLFDYLNNKVYEENQRTYPSDDDIQNIVNKKEEKISKEIRMIEKRIKEFSAIKNANYRQHENYSSEIQKTQKDIEFYIGKKEEILTEINKIKEEIKNIIDEDKKIDITENINMLVTKGLKDAKKKEQDKLNNKIEKISADAASKAAKEFAPHFQRLKSQHNTVINELKTQFSIQIQKINQDKFDECRKIINETRSNYEKQLLIQIDHMDKQNAITLERYRQKLERDMGNYESDIISLKRELQTQVNRITMSGKQDAEREKNRYMRQIDSLKLDIQNAKKIAESKLLSANELRKDNEIIRRDLPVLQLELRLEEKNQVIIKRRKEQLEEENREFKEQMKKKTQETIERKNEEAKEKLKRLQDDLEFISYEEKRMTEVRERYINQRKRVERLFEGAKDELTTIKNDVRFLKDWLFETTTRVPVSECSKIANENQDVIGKLLKDFQDIELDEAREEHSYTLKVQSIKEKHKKALKLAGDKVKEVITAKDEQIKQLNEQILKVNETIEALTKAMKE